MQAIITKYHGAANVNGSRISATCYGGRVTIGYDSALNSEENHTKAAQALAAKMKWTPDNKKMFANTWYRGAMPGESGYCFVLAMEQESFKVGS